MRYAFLIFFFSLVTPNYSFENDAITTVSPVNPLSNEIGTLCSSNASNVWLDIMLVIDTSNAVLQKDLQRLGIMLSNVFESITIGNFTKHSTRVGLITYDSSYSDTMRYYFNSISNNDQLNQILSNLSQYYSPKCNGSGLDYALNDAYRQFTGSGSYRKGAVIIYDAAYPISTTFTSPSNMKNYGISIITIADGGAHSNLSDSLGNIASPGMNFSSLDPNLAEKIKSSLTIANCFCPPGYHQMKISNQTLNTGATYVNCFYGYSGDTSPDIAKQTCDPDILASVTSAAKLDFITDVVIPAQMIGAKSFTTGAFRSGGRWNWQNYNNTQFPFGDFPSTTNATGGDIGYFRNTHGFNWAFVSGGSGDNDARPFVCQTQPYDADNMRDLSDY